MPEKTSFEILKEKVDFAPAFEKSYDLISLKQYNDTNQQFDFVNLACRISQYTHYFPKNYKVFLEENSELFLSEENNIFSLSPNFPTVFETLDFNIELLVFDIGNDSIIDDVDYGPDVIMGMAITAKNGSSFVFYLEQLKILDSHVASLSFAENLEEILLAEE